MSNPLAEILSDHLQADSNNTIRVQSNSLRLKKSAGSANKFVFSLEDITQKFGSIDKLLAVLPQKGFTDKVQFTLVKIYITNGKTSYHTVKEITRDLTEKIMNTTPVTQTHQAPIPQQNVFGLGSLAAPELISKMVEAERGKDYKQRAEKSEEELKNAHSKIRILEEKNSSLELKIATVKEHAEIQRQKDALDKKSFLDTETGTTIIETLAGLIPKGIEALANKQAPVQIQTPLAGPGSHVSEIKKTVIHKVQAQNFSDKQTGMLNYILDNWQQDFIEPIMQLIKKREENGN